ncbi:MAG TPA: FAD-binding oxidoreductase, partial [Phnomibacter sp.]|nr:FAD-binding oxidoreductase [Phnomibacter sp.]
MQTIDITITERIPQAAGAVQFILQPQVAVPYKAGQFLPFVTWLNGQEVRRSYSLCSAPVLNEPWSIVLKPVPNGLMSRWWVQHARPGMVLQSMPPAGMFTLPDITDIPLLQFFLFAAGSGIAPILSMLKQLLYAHPAHHAVLVYSNSSPHHTIFANELRALQLQFVQRLQIIWMYSNHPNLMQARLSTYTLQAIMQQYRTLPYTQVYAYACGPWAYMQMVQVTLLTLGLPAAHYRREVFDDAPPSTTSQPRYYDKNNRTIRLSYQGVSHSLYVRYNQSILEAALQAGIPLP